MLRLALFKSCIPIGYHGDICLETANHAQVESCLTSQGKFEWSGNSDCSVVTVSFAQQQKYPQFEGTNLCVSIKVRRRPGNQPLAASQKDLLKMMDRPSKTSEEYDIKMNIKETKIVIINSGKETTVDISTIDGKELEHVGQLILLPKMQMMQSVI